MKQKLQQILLYSILSMALFLPLFANSQQACRKLFSVYSLDNKASNTSAFNYKANHNLTQANKFKIDYPKILKGLERLGRPNFENTVLVLEKLEANLSLFSFSRDVLNNAFRTPETLPQIQTISQIESAYYNKLYTNKKIYSHLKQIRKNLTDNSAEAILVDRYLQQFESRGVHLSKSVQKRIKKIYEDLDALYQEYNQSHTDYNNNVDIANLSLRQVQGLSNDFLSFSAQQNKMRHQRDGFSLTATYAFFNEAIATLKNQGIRELLFKLRFQRNQFDKFDNTKIIDQILKLRQELAELLGYTNYAEYAQKSLLLQSTQKAKDLIESGLTQLKERVNENLSLLREFANTIKPNEKFHIWDIFYYEHLYKTQKLNYSAVEIRKYFPVSQVLLGLFKTVESMYQVKITEVENDSYSDGITTYKIESENGKVIGYFELDLYSRPQNKASSGAWSYSLTPVQSRDNQITGFSSMGTNFIKSQNGETHLSLKDIQDLFHEMGHTLHNLLSKSPYVSLSGTKVMRDFNEFPSQYMEYILFTPQVLQLISRDPKTGKPLSLSDAQKIIEAHKFNLGYFKMILLMRYYIDLNLHLNLKHENESYYDFEKRILSPFLPEGIEWVGGFTHQFTLSLTNSYPAHVYSYFLGDILAAQSFARHNGSNVLTNTAFNQQFQKLILETGNTKPLDQIIKELLQEDINPHYLMNEP